MREAVAVGPRVFLSPLMESDIDDRYLSWLADAEHLKYYSGSGRTFSRETAVNELAEGRESGRLFIFGVFLLEGQKLLGTVKIGPINSRHQTSDLVIHIGERSEGGKGIASEAISLGNQVAFEQLGIRKLYGGMYAANEGAIRAYLRAGWVIEGRRRDHYLVDGTPMDRVLVACFKHPPQED